MENIKTETYLGMVDAIKSLNRADLNNLDKLESLKIAELGRVTSYYIPFDYVNTKAKVVLVGITPGMTQLVNALSSAKNSIERGLDPEEALRQAKNEGAFSGALRNKLVEMLDHAGLNAKLGLTTCMSLFDEHSHLVHTTSLLRHAVFVKGEAYSGHTPKMLKNPLMLKMIDDYFKEEVKLLPDAIYIPLGKSVSIVMEELVADGVIKESQVLLGMPHPSGSNGEPIAYFLGRKKKADLTGVDGDAADLTKASILRKIQELNF